MEQRSPDETEKAVSYFSQKILLSSINYKWNRRQDTGREETTLKIQVYSRVSGDFHGGDLNETTESLKLYETTSSYG